MAAESQGVKESLHKTEAMGYSRKYPQPPGMDDTELGTWKFQDFQEGQ